jgi:demethylmenaquinone methyltransferase/2-methoxy-6-polyprenyl-1,4-benzoquinol methylase
MFNDLAGDYDRLNRIMSLRLDKRWRSTLLDELDPAPDADLVDLGTGTGDLALAAASRAPHGRVVGVDLAESMLARARAKQRDRDPEAAVDFIQATALDLPLPDASLDAAISAFTLRNVRDRPAFAREARRVLRPGGRLATLEIHGLGDGLLGRLAGPYIHRLVPSLGAALTGQDEAYRYLSSSVDAYPSPAAVADLLSAVGLADVRSRPLLGGIVAVHHARAP